VSDPRLEQLLDIEAIKQVKYRYIRCLDCKEWEEMADCFTEDAVSAYDSGAHAAKGRDTILGFLEDALGRTDIVSLHQVHNPEIELTSSTTAKGRWYLEDTVINPGEAAAALRAHTLLQGAAFYEDEYVKVDGQWKICHTGYQRTWEMQEPLSDDPERHLRSRWHP